MFNVKHRNTTMVFGSKHASNFQLISYINTTISHSINETLHWINLFDKFYSINLVLQCRPIFKCMYVGMWFVC